MQSLCSSFVHVVCISLISIVFDSYVTSSYRYVYSKMVPGILWRKVKANFMYSVHKAAAFFLVIAICSFATLVIKTMTLTLDLSLQTLHCFRIIITEHQDIFISFLIWTRVTTYTCLSSSTQPSTMPTLGFVPFPDRFGTLRFGMTPKQRNILKLSESFTEKLNEKAEARSCIYFFLL